MLQKHWKSVAQFLYWRIGIIIQVYPVFLSRSFKLMLPWSEGSFNFQHVKKISNKVLKSFSRGNLCHMREFRKRSQRVMDMLRALALLVDWNPVCLTMKTFLRKQCVNKRRSTHTGTLPACCSGKGRGRIQTYLGRGNWTVLSSFLSE